jgi:NAD(P)-dependent dehydrogenase (short-subunit alcohol dehydrogenase family)
VSLEGKCVLVTGGSRGLGQAMAQVFTRAGAQVAFTYSRDDEGAGRTLERTRAEGREAVARKVSVLDAAGTADFVTALEKRFGAVEALVNNCGINQNMPLALLEEEDFDRVMGVNVKGVFLTSKAVLRGMIRRRAGVIVNLGSVVASRTLDAPIHYSASKAAVEGLTHALAREVARYGIRVNCLAPGLLEGGLSAALPSHRREDYLAHCALGRVASFEEVARFTAFLLADGAGYMTGETIHVDGCL